MNPKELNQVLESMQTDKFLEKYDLGNLEFNDLKYRQGARITSTFGLTQGYRIVNSEFKWDSIRIHSGTDRSGLYGYDGQHVDNVVYSPFDFERSQFYDWGKDHVYGSMVRLFSDEYGFEMRIVHMFPNEIKPEILELLKNKKPIKRDTLIGKAGDYGKSDGRHTHTEIVSQNNSCKMLDSILLKKYNGKSTSEYTESDIEAVYRKQEYFKDKDIKVIMSHFQEQRDKRRVHFINKYLYQYEDWFYNWKVRTRYSSNLLFNGL